MRPFPDREDDRGKLDTFFGQVEGSWAVVYESRLRWPSYHLPLAKPSEEPRWWRLYRRELNSDQFQAVIVPRDRDYVRGIPGLER